MTPDCKCHNSLLKGSFDSNAVGGRTIMLMEVEDDAHAGGNSVMMMISNDE